MKKNDDLTLLGDILDAIFRIESYTDGVSKENFPGNLMMQDAVMHQIEIIGEASNSVSDEFQEKHSSLPWMQMRAIRNKIVHDYRGINLQVIWETVVNDLPALKTRFGNCWGNNKNEKTNIPGRRSRLERKLSACH